MANLKKYLSLRFQGLNPKLIIGFALMSIIPLLSAGYLLVSYVFPKVSVDEIIYISLIFIISVIIAFLGFLVAKDLIKPILKLTKWARLVQGGDVTQRLKKDREDETGELFDFFNDVTEKLQQDIERIRELSITDELTGIYNYRYFYRNLENEINRILRYPQALSLVILDIDYFKKYNDTYGHLVGDLLLKEIAQLLKNNSRTVDILARYGGEEFVFILPSTSEAQASIFGERIRRQMEEHRFASEGIPKECKVTISVGVAEFKEGDTVEKLINKADHALYKAKEGGRNKVCSFSSERL